MAHRIVLNQAQLGAKLSSLRGSKSPVYLYFTSTKDGDKGQRWCPDCANADPVLDEAFEALPASATILEIQAPRHDWKVEPGPKHPYRSPPFSVRGIPTLALWNTTEEKVQRRFTEGECEQIEVLLELFESHF